MIVLSNNENPDPNPVLSHLHMTEIAHRYTTNNPTDLLEKIAEYCSVNKNEVLLAAGSSDLIEQMARLFVEDGGNIIYSDHSFIWYRMITKIIGAKANIVGNKNHHHDLDAITAAINEKTKIIFIDNPNNPFGTVLSYSDLKAFIKSVPESVYIVIDEAYYEYVDTKDYQSCIPLIHQHKNLIVTRTFSKAFALAGLRVGYGITNQDFANKIRTVTRPYNLNSVAIAAANLALENSSFVNESINRNGIQIKKIEAFCREKELPFIPSQANFIAICLGSNAIKITHSLNEQGIMVSPLENYGFNKWIRVTTGTPHQVDRFLKALQAILS